MRVGDRQPSVLFICTSHFIHQCGPSPTYYKIFCQEPWVSKSEMPWEKFRHSLQNVPLLTFPNKQLLISIFKLQRKSISLNTVIFSLVICRKNLCPQYTIWHLFKVFFNFLLACNIHRGKYMSHKCVAEWIFINRAHLCYQRSGWEREYITNTSDVPLSVTPCPPSPDITTVLTSNTINEFCLFLELHISEIT